MLKNYKLILLSVLFSLVANFHFLYSYIASPVSRNILISDIDETYYLRKPFDTYAHYSDQPIFNTESPNLFSLPPTTFIDLILGRLGVTLNLTPIELGILLDLLCCSIAFIGFYKFFSQIIPMQSLSYTTTILFLLSPWMLMGIWEILPYKLSTISSAPSIPHALPPIFRGFYTQIGMSLIGYILAYFCKFYLAKPQNTNNLKISGFLSGILIHLYFFAWGSMIVALPITIVLIHINFKLHKNPNHIKFLSELACFCFFALLGSSLGLLEITNGNNGGLANLPISPKYWNIQIESILFLIIFSICALKTELSIRGKFLISFGQALLIAEIILVNTQGILNQVIASYHFPVLYLRPLFSSIIICILFNEIIKRNYGNIFEKSPFKYLPYFFLLFISLQTIRIPNFYRQELEPLSELLSEINTKTLETDTISMLTLNFPFQEKVDNMLSFSILPNLIHTITNRNFLFQNLAQPGQAEEMDEQFKRELLTGWIFSGKVQPIWPCLSEFPELPGDIFYLTETAFRLNRHSSCSTYHIYKDSLTACSLLQHFRVTIVLHQNHHFEDSSLRKNPYLNMIWHNKDFILYSLDLPKALGHECKYHFDTK